MSDYTTKDQAAQFAGNLKYLQERAGLNTKQLAQCSHVSYGTVSALRNGDMLPSLRTLLRLAHGLGVPPAYLLAGITADCE